MVKRQKSHRGRPRSLPIVGLARLIGQKRHQGGTGGAITETMAYPIPSIHCAPTAPALARRRKTQRPQDPDKSTRPAPTGETALPPTSNRARERQAPHTKPQPCSNSGSASPLSPSRSYPSSSPLRLLHSASSGLSLAAEASRFDRRRRRLIFLLYLSEMRVFFFFFIFVR